MQAKLSVTWLSLALGLCLTSTPAQNTPSASPGADRSAGRDFSRGPRGGRSSSAPFQSTPMAKDDVEKKVLEVLQDMRQAGLGISAPQDDARLLRLLVESSGAKHAVEIGTYHGYSSIWMCLGLRTTGGKLTTFEISKENAEISRQNFKRAGVESLVTLLEGDAHQEVNRLEGPIDLVFIDADKEGYTDYLNKLLPLMRPGGLVVGHNINANMADPAYIKAITTSAGLETLFVNTGSGGISVSMKKR